MIENIIAILVILVIVGGAVFYIVRAKKNGKKCIGCPDGCNCSQCSHTCAQKSMMSDETETE